MKVPDELKKIRIDYRVYRGELHRVDEREDARLLRIAEANGLRAPIYCFCDDENRQIQIEDLPDPFPSTDYLDKATIDLLKEPWIVLYDCDSSENRTRAAWAFTHMIVSLKLERTLDYVDHKLRQDPQEQPRSFGDITVGEVVEGIRRRSREGSSRGSRTQRILAHVGKLYRGAFRLLGW